MLTKLNVTYIVCVTPDFVYSYCSSTGRESHQSCEGVGSIPTNVQRFSLKHLGTNYMYYTEVHVFI